MKKFILIICVFLLVGCSNDHVTYNHQDLTIAYLGNNINREIRDIHVSYVEYFDAKIDAFNNLGDETLEINESFKNYLLIGIEASRQTRGALNIVSGNLRDLVDKDVEVSLSNRGHNDIRDLRIDGMDVTKKNDIKINEEKLVDSFILNKLYEILSARVEILEMEFKNLKINKSGATATYLNLYNFRNFSYSNFNKISVTSDNIIKSEIFARHFSTLKIRDIKRVVDGEDSIREVILNERCTIHKFRGDTYEKSYSC